MTRARRLNTVADAIPATISVVLAAMSGCASDGLAEQVSNAVTIKVFPNGASHGETANAPLVAFQDGDQPWAVLNSDNGVYHAAAADRYGIAVICKNIYDFRTYLQLRYQTASEMREVDIDGCPNDRSFGLISGRITGVSSDEHITLQIGTPLGLSGSGVGPRYEVDAPLGERAELLAWTHTEDSDNNEIPSAYVRSPEFVVRTAQTIDLDFDADGAPATTAAFAPPEIAATDSLAINAFLRTPVSRFRTGRHRYGADRPSSYDTIAGSLLRPGELIEISTIVSDPAGTSIRTAHAHLSNPRAIAPELLPPWSPDPPTLDRVPYPRPTVVLPHVPKTLARQHYFVSFSTTASEFDYTDYRDWEVSITGGYVGDQASLTFTAPDLSQLPGWEAEMELHAGRPMRWSYRRLESTSPSEALRDGDWIKDNSGSGEIGP